MPTQREETYSATLDCRLTDAERANRGRQLAALLNDQTALEEEKADVTSDLTRQIKLKKQAAGKVGQ
jgi:hypothetical protein